MDPDPRQTLGRRLPRAVLVALAVALAGGGAIGFATAAGASSFSVPAPMGGDRATYEVEGPGQAWDGQQARIEVRAPEPLMMPDGTWASAAVLRAGADAARSSFTWGGSTFEVAVVAWKGAVVDAGSGDALAAVEVSSASADGGSGSLFFDVLGGEQSQSASVGVDVTFRPAGTPCAVRSPLQGSSVAVGDRIRVEGCLGRFTVVGMRPLDGRDALLLRSNATRLWYQAGIPYPVRYDFKVGTPDEASWRMAGFTRGESPLAPGPLPPAVTPVPIEPAPVGRLGPEPAGVARFSLEAAVQHAIDYDTQVEDFTRAHPDWFVREASYEESVQDGTVTGKWGVLMRGGASQVYVGVTEPAEAQSSPVPQPVNQALGDAFQAAGLPGSNYVVVSDSDPFPEPEWPPECRPATLPGIASLAGRWAQMERRPASDANAYHFRLSCFLAGEARPGFQVAVGDARQLQPDAADPDPLAAPSSSNVTQVLRMLALDSRGVFTVESTETAMSRSSWGALQEPSSQPAAAPMEHAGAGWSVPPAPVAAGITLLSLLAALGYWLWPVAKAGPLGLFSRVQGPALLRHPVRAELMQRIEAEPGIHYQDLVRAAGKGKGAVEHHLRKLEASGLAKSLHANGYTCWFPAAYDRRLVGAAPALKSDGARAMFAAIQASPGASAREVAAATGLSAAAVNHHLGRLAAAGLVSVVRDGRRLRLQATPLASQLGGQAPAAGAAAGG